MKVCLKMIVSAPLVVLVSSATALPATSDGHDTPLSTATPTVATASASGAGDDPEMRVATRFDQASLARDLPSSRTISSLLETAEPMAISDRISGAGLYLSEPSRFSMRGASWTQNQMLLDGIDITDPLFGGTSLLIPDPELLQTIEATSAVAPIDNPAPGTTLSLSLRRPSDSWRGTAQAHGLVSSMQSGPEAVGEPPPIARFGSLADASVLAAGPLSHERLRGLFSARYTRLARQERADLETRRMSLGSGLVRLDYGANRSQVSWLAAGQRSDRPSSRRVPFSTDPLQGRAFTLGTSLRWSFTDASRSASAFTGFWTTRVEPSAIDENQGLATERLRDGPIPDLVPPAASRRSVLSAGARFSLPPAPLAFLSHVPRLGFDLVRTSLRERAGAGSTLPESVGGIAARVWDYAWAGSDSRRHVLELAAWVDDRLMWGDRLVLRPGLRLERTVGRADGAAEGVSWTTLAPRVSARFAITRSGRLALIGGWGLYRHRLRLSALAFGDPNAAHASVYRWLDANDDGRFNPSERGPLVALRGPGAPNAERAAIDPALHAPRLRELVVGIDARLGRAWQMQVIGTDRRERDLLESVNVGVDDDDYFVRYLLDPAGSIDGPEDDQLLPVFDRAPESFGRDRFLLTNVRAHHTRHQGVEVRVEKSLGRRFALLAGATASRTEIEGGNRGFRAGENDQGLLGELYDNPNAHIYVRGRSFFDRAYTIKLAGVCRAPGDWRLAAVARYQDGQPFGRLVVVADLAQGAEAVAGTPRGQTGPLGATDPLGRPLTTDGHRFTYSLTVDARIEKGLRFGSWRVALVAEAFNLLDMRNEVEEDVMWGPAFRSPTAVQPPFVVRLGARLDF